jgi:Lar family restriction alleviation protein
VKKPASTEKKKGEFELTGSMLPCPFCGSEKLHGSKHDGVFPYVICNDCGASTGFARNQDEAVANWNRRA